MNLKLQKSVSDISLIHWIAGYFIIKKLFRELIRSAIFQSVIFTSYDYTAIDLQDLHRVKNGPGC